MRKTIKNSIIKKDICDKKSAEKLYVKYINNLVKAENMQNRLERMCAFMVGKRSNEKSDNIIHINNNMNKVMVNIMIAQKLIDYLNYSNKCA